MNAVASIDLHEMQGEHCIYAGATTQASIDSLLVAARVLPASLLPSSAMEMNGWRLVSPLSNCTCC